MISSNPNQDPDPNKIAERYAWQSTLSQNPMLGLIGVKNPLGDPATQAAEQQLAGAGKQADFLRGTQQDLVRQLMSQDPTTSRGFQQALAQSQGAVGRSLGASGLGDSPFAAALQGQAAGNLGAQFEQQRMQQLFQALGLNPGLAASPELSAKLLEMLSNQPDLLASLLPLLGAGAGAAIGSAGGPAGALAGAQIGGTIFGGRR